MSFPLRNAFIVSHKFGYVVASFSLNSKKVLNFFLYSFLDQGIIEKSVVQFPRECWLSIIYVVTEEQPQSMVVRQDAWDDFNIFVSVEACFVTKYMVNFGEGTMSC